MPLERPRCQTCPKFLPDNPGGLPDAEARPIGAGGSCARDRNLGLLRNDDVCDQHPEWREYEDDYMARRRRDRHERSLGLVARDGEDDRCP